MPETPKAESVLLDEWMRLNRTWPSDGWDGAAYARAEHHRLVKLVEADLAADHAEHGHGPCINYGVDQVSCICGQPTGGRLADTRQLDRYGKWLQVPAQIDGPGVSGA